MLVFTPSPTGRKPEPFTGWRESLLKGDRRKADVMFLLKDYYTPAETVEIINNRLNPIPKMEIEHLVSIVEKEALYLYAQSNLGTFKVKEGFFTFLHESANRWRYKGAGLLLAHRLMSDHRKNWNEVLPAPRYADSDNELKEIPVLWDAVFKRADIESFIENTLAKQEKHNQDNANNTTLKGRRLKTMMQVNKEHPDLKTKREVFEKCQEKNNKDFSIAFESFSTGSNAIWNTAKESGVNWTNIG